MQIKNILLLQAITLAAVSAAPINEPRATAVDYNKCMTIAFDANQGLDFYDVPAGDQATVVKNCKTCIAKTSGCSGSSCEEIFNSCAKDMGMAVSK